MKNLITLLSLLTKAIQSSVIPTVNQICPTEHSSDCYPKIFQPTTEWQPIRPGQDIPAGLHIRLNIDTLTKEAKLLAPEENLDQSDTELVIVPIDEGNIESTEKESSMAPPNPETTTKETEDHLSSDEVEDDEDSILEDLKKQHQSETSSGLGHALSIISKFKSSSTQMVDEALNTLLDWSHSIQHGTQIVNSESIAQLYSIAFSKDQSFTIKEKAFRIMAQCVRNNLAATESFSETFPNAVQNLLFLLRDDEFYGDELNEHEVGILQKRILGVLGPLVEAPNFRFSPDLEVVLWESFVKLQPAARRRCLDVLETINIENRLSKREEDNEIVDFSNCLQQKLIQEFPVHGDEDEHEMIKYFNVLVDIHQNYKELKAGDDFLSWLSEHNELRKEKVKRDVDVDNDILEKLKISRHEVFGNPMALRKAFADEL